MNFGTNNRQAPLCYIGVDVGGTKVAAGLVSLPEGVIRARRIIPTLPERGGDAVLADVARLVEDLSAEARTNQQRVAGVGLGVCELVDLDGNVVSAHCVAWRGVPVRERMARFGPTVVEADVRAAALAETMFGAGRTASTFLYVTIGTGISACLVIDGKPFPGARGAAGTVASSPLPSTAGLPPQVLEEIASGPALVARFNQLHGRAQSGQDVLAAAAAGHAEARQVVCSAAETMGATIGWLVNVLDPEMVVLGGGLGLSEGLYRDTLVAAARRHFWSDLHRHLTIVPAATGLDAGVIGAAAAAWKHQLP